MSARKRKASLKSKGILAKSVLVLLAGYFIFSIFSTRIDIANKKAEYEALKEKTDALEITNEEYKTLLETCGTDSYIERIAREKLDYVYPNERVYVDRSGK